MQRIAAMAASGARPQWSVTMPVWTIGEVAEAVLRWFPTPKQRAHPPIDTYDMSPRANTSAMAEGSNG